MPPPKLKTVDHWQVTVCCNGRQIWRSTRTYDKGTEELGSSPLLRMLDRRNGDSGVLRAVMSLYSEARCTARTEQGHRTDIRPWEHTSCSGRGTRGYIANRTGLSASQVSKAIRVMNRPSLVVKVLAGELTINSACQGL